MNLLIALALTSFTAHAQTSATPASALPPTDAQIAAIVEEANDADIDNGKMAKSKTKNKTIQAFADHMVKDHKQANKELKAVLKKTDIDKTESPTSEGIEKTAEDTAKRLKGLKGADFDKAYVDSEVELHNSVLMSLEKNLIPNAKAPELQGYLKKTREVIAAHLAHAKELQATLNQTK